MLLLFVAPVAVADDDDDDDELIRLVSLVAAGAIFPAPSADSITTVSRARVTLCY